MQSLITRLAILAALAMPLPAAAQVPRAPAAARFPEVEESALLALAGLDPIASNGDVLRYAVVNVLGYSRNVATAVIVQVRATYDDDHPRVLHVDLVMPSGGGGWQVVRRREAPMYSDTFDRLLRNLVGAASVVGSRANRRTTTRCSHSATSRLDIRVPGESLSISRTAHCSDDAPATVAGNLLIASSERALTVAGIAAEPLPAER
jgi:hypothetical protein